MVPNMIQRFVRAGAALVAFVPALAAAQAPAAPAAPKVGDVAPDFTITSVTAAGQNAAPFKLSSLRGKTVVVAFFPKARTSGCTVQMESYRDKYAEIFRSGKDVTLIAISTDTPDALISWAKDAKFPFAFGSDADGSVGQMYGAFLPGPKMDNRYLFVVGPDGKITYAVTPFRQMAQEAYAELGDAIGKASSAKAKGE
jgi:peroxiredoxin Q/BCP